MAKRLLDLGLTFGVLLVFSPVWLLLTILVRIKLGSPILFTQLRPGLNGEVFKMTKFRTMIDEVDSNGDPLPDEERLTPFGIFLRATSLDELPGLLSVINGNMSLVGPRPLLVEYLPLYSKEQSRRHCVKPGVTGWAQVNGRNAIGWEEKFRLDVWYVDNRSFVLDIKILYLTVIKVFKADGVSPANNKIMPKFEGYTNTD